MYIPVAPLEAVPRARMKKIINSRGAMHCASTILIHKKNAVRNLTAFYIIYFLFFF